MNEEKISPKDSLCPKCGLEFKTVEKRDAHIRRKHAWMVRY